MNEDQVLNRLDNLDQRVGRIEQFLPTLPTRTEVRSVVDEAIAQAVAPLATKEELREAVAKLATKEELREAVAKLATREELRETVAAAVAPLATKEELRETVATAIAPLATKEELREEGERSRRYMLMLFEEVRGDIRLFADAHGLLDQRDAQQHRRTVADLGALDGRVTALEAKRRRRLQ